MDHFEVQKNHKYMFLFGDKNFGICDFSGGYNGLRSEAYQNKIDAVFGPCETKLMKQVHGINGLVVDTVNQYNAPVECDFLITNQSQILLLILTADCLPIFLYDPILNSIGAVHAGWRGSILGLVDRAIDAMITTFHSSIESLYVIFGPCARLCCYEVGTDFIKMLESIDTSYSCQTLFYREGKCFFDLVLYNLLRIKNKGILESNISTTFACTMCSYNFFSSKRRKNFRTEYEWYYAFVALFKLK